MTKIVDLSKKRPPVTYTVDITQHWDGRMEAFVRDVSDDARARDAVADALVRLAEKYMNRRVSAAGDAMLAVMLANIDQAMGASHGAPAVFTVTPAELGTWADAVQEYEAARFPCVA